jgi:hypothetical protein
MAKLQTMGGTESKDTIYVDVDDEITTIIDKVRSSSGKVVALVLPKRATVLQSIVNMKLLKRTAEGARKHLVLVTTEAGLLPLAGNVGLHVASTPTSKPVIPPAPEGPGDETEDIDEPLKVADGTDDDFDADAVAGKTVGELSGAVAASKLAADQVDENLELGDEDEIIDDTADGKKADKKTKGNKKLRVPNFDSFRKKIILAVVALVVLIAAYIVGFVVLPKATVTISTDTSTIKTNMTLNLDTTAKTLNASSKILPATAQSSSKSYNQQVAATGQQNNGQAATGSATFSAGACSGDVPSDVPAGTGVSTGGQTYITQGNASFTPVIAHGHCTFQSGSVTIAARAGGTVYNTSGTATFTVSGRSDVTGSGSANGGTDNITKVVQQSDIDGAKAKLSTQDTTSIKAGLQAVFQGIELKPIPMTFLASDPQITSSVQAGSAADTVTVTEVVNYTMLGVNPTDLKTLVDANVTSQLDKGKQVILDDGVAKATFSAQTPATATNAVVALSTSSVAGPQLGTNSLRTQIAGKKAGDIRNLIKQTPGVTDVTVKYSPFWVTATPSKASKITVTIVKAGGSQ